MADRPQASRDERLRDREFWAPMNGGRVAHVVADHGSLCGRVSPPYATRQRMTEPECRDCVQAVVTRG